MKRVEWTSGSETVRGRLYAPPGTRPQPAPLVFLIHGLSSSSVEFYDFPEKIAKEGFAVLTFDYRGHGESDGERGVLSKDRALEDLKAGLEAMVKEYKIDTNRLALVGHSVGGGMAICAAPHLPNLQCVVALAPIARLKDEMNAFEFVGYNMMRVVNAPVRLFKKDGIRVPYKVDYQRLYATQPAIDRARKDNFLQPTIPVKNYKALVRDFNAIACAKNVHLPALVMVAEYDIVVGKYNSRRVYNALAGPKKWVEVPKSGHSMCGDARSDFVAQHCNEFLSEHLKGVPAV